MITRKDITETFAMLTGNNSSLTPKPSEITVRAWADYFDDHPKWIGDDLAAAAHEYCKRPRDRVVQPADLGEIIRSFYRERYDRMDPDERPAALGSSGVRRDRHGYIDKSEPDPPDYPLDWTSQQRVDAYWARLRGRNGEDEPVIPEGDITGKALSVRCPWCGATPGEHCVNPRHGNPREPLKSLVHPSRRDLANGIEPGPDPLVARGAALAALAQLQMPIDGAESVPVASAGCPAGPSGDPDLFVAQEGAER